MNRPRACHLAPATGIFALAVAMLSAVQPGSAVVASGAGGASWTPSATRTVTLPTDFLVADDSYDFVTDEEWTSEQVDGLAPYVRGGLRYTHEVNDRSGRLSATGFWATNYPDPAFDRDDDDEDGRWEEAEVTAGTASPTVGQTYRSIIGFSRWHTVERRDGCDWSWDLRAGEAEVLAQLSREALGEWQAERYTRTYERVPFERGGTRPTLPVGSIAPQCGPRLATDPSHEGIVVTFSRPLSWSEFLGLSSDGGAWSAFEAIGGSQRDDLVWTCGGPVLEGSGLEASGLDACRAMDVRVDGVTAAGGYFDAESVMRLRTASDVARVTVWRDDLTDFLAGVAGFDVQPPDLTLDDAYWSLYLR